MKWMIASDIHGSLYYCEKMLAAFEKEQADKLLLLGDLLYHGPRNDLPKEYNPKEVIRLLNGRKEKILCVRGNCEAEVDQMVLQFPVMAEYAFICDEGYTIFATHGHIFGESNPPLLQAGDVLLCGHTHVPKCVKHALFDSEQKDNEGDSFFLYMNPGSVSIPKEGSYHGYMVLEDGKFDWKDLDGNVVMEYKK